MPAPRLGASLFARTAGEGRVPVRPLVLAPVALAALGVASLAVGVSPVRLSSLLSGSVADR